MEFCSYFEQIADSPNFLRKLALEFCLRPKSLKLRHSSNWAANLFKIWQNSNASLSVAYLFFIIYSKSTVGQLTKLNFFLCINRYIPIHPISNHTDNNKQHHISSSKHFQSDHDRCDQCICCASKDCCIS